MLKVRNLILASILLGVTFGCGGENANPIAFILQVGISSGSYSPAKIVALPGQTLEWQNSRVQAQSVTGDVAGGPDSSTQFPNGMAFNNTYRFTVPTGTPHGTKIFYHSTFTGTAGDGTQVGTGTAAEIDVI